MMAVAGIAWGAYSIRGRGIANPLQATRENFLRACLLVTPFIGLLAKPDGIGAAALVSAVASGALASGAGYAVWYSVLPRLKATSASVAQLSVPAIAAIGGTVFLGEPLTLQPILSSILVLGGVAVVVTAGAPG